MTWFNNQKIWVRLVFAIWLMLSLMWMVSFYWSYTEQRSNAETQARDFATSVHQMTLASLTGMMMTGTIAQRQVYLDQIKNTSNIHELEVLRGDAVAKQFGPGLATSHALDADERQVLESGKEFFQLDHDKGFLKAVLPAIAQKNYLGKNCLTCHVVPEGTVLGAVSMKISLEKVNAQTWDFMRKLCGLAFLLAIPFLIFVYLFIQRSVTRPLAAAIACFDRIGAGDYDNTIEVHSKDEVGMVMHDLELMQRKLKADVSESRRTADETMRIKVALDNATTNAMIADNDGKIIYLNASTAAMLQAAEADIRRELPQFNAATLIGSSFDIFHKNPAHQRNLLAGLKQPYKTEIRIGGRTFRLTANPVINEQRERLGTSVEWEDATQEVHIQQEVHGIVDAALRGDLSGRVSLDDKEGYMRQLSEGINQLVQTNEMILDDILRVLSAMAHGDLTEQITNDYEGKFAALKADANTTVSRLQEVMGQILNVVESINTASGEIAQGNTDLSQRTEEQASSLEQTVASMDELTGTVKRNAANAASANQLAISASDVAARGGEVVERVVSTMSSISESSRKIVDIISVIDGIAFQTNILALNAAVEAARAGEQGRGFAVVATEVRNLAQRSAAAAKEIKALIGDSVERVQNGSTLVEQAGENMAEIVASVQRVTGIMADISAASLEQSSGLERVNRALAEMDGVTQQNAALVEEAAAAAESLEEQAKTLVEAVSMFKLDKAMASSRPQLADRRPAGKRVTTARAPARAMIASAAEDSWEEF